MDYAELNDNNYVAYPLVRFKNGKIVFNKDYLSQINIDKNKEFIVISLIGRARTGKSSFLNLLISYLNGHNEPIFESNSSIEHCTQGIDMYVDNNIIFLDCQGIEYQDSSHDIPLLLMSYLFSNLIIFNDQHLNNSTLKSLEPIVSFVNYIDTNDHLKPDLLFRIRDYGLDNPINEILSKILHKCDDQYQTIRDSMRNLFNSINAISTNILDRTEINYLKNKDYMKVLEVKENGIEGCFNNLVCNLSNYKKVEYQCFITQVNIIINMINDNEKIDFNKLDVSNLIIKSDINEFINNIDKVMYEKIEVDGTQDLYDNNVVPRQKMMSDITRQFNNKFHLVDSKIKLSYYNKLLLDLEKPITEAVKTCERITMEKYKEIDKQIGNYILKYVNDFSEIDFTEESHDFYKTDKKIKKLLDKLNIYYQPTFVRIYTDIEKKLAILENKSKDIHTKNVNLINHNKNSVDNCLENISKDDYIVNFLLDENNIEPFDTYQEVIDKFECHVIDLIKDIVNNIKYFDIIDADFNTELEEYRNTYNFNNTDLINNRIDYDKLFNNFAQGGRGL